MSLLATYNATVAQPSLRPVYKGEDGPFRPECIAENLARVCGLVEKAAKEHDAKLVVFPEFCVQGYALKRSIADWERAGITLPGPETVEMAKVARATGVHIAGAVFERIPAFPGRYFMSGFMISPDGATPEDQLKLVYRKLYALSSKTRPGDIYDPYVATFGPDSLFPVVDTPLGKIGCAVAGDLAMPEMTRTLALRGAELIFVPTAATFIPGYASPTEAPDMPLGPAMAMVRRVRAWENLTYLAASNIGPFLDDDGAAGSARVPSEIVDYVGRVVARADTDGETLVTARIDMAALRRHRSEMRFNYLAHLQPELHTPAYASAKLSPVNAFSAAPHSGEQPVLDMLGQAWAEQVKAGPFNG